MTRQTVASVCFIFLLAIALLYLGLAASEQGLKEVSGRDVPGGAFVVRYRGETVEITLAGQQITVNLAEIKDRLGSIGQVRR